MSGSATAAQAYTEIHLPSVEAYMNFSQNIPRARSNVLDPSQTYRPLEAHKVTIHDARPIRGQLDLDKEGFILVDHVSSVSHLRDARQLEGTYHDEIKEVIKKISGADYVLPYRTYCQVRLSQRAPGENGDDTTRPAGFVHADVTQRTFHDWAKWVQEDEKIKVPPYKRVVMYNTWRAVSKPPQDFPLALTDGFSIKPGKCVIMDNVTSMEAEGHTVETRLGLYDPDDKWYYFSNMREEELLIFKGYDTKFNDDQTVWHSSFNNTEIHPDATPRESLEARFFAFWV
ncbi:hypothetical protein M0D69_41860 [Caballeronia sp. SEWSISQ10-4 2]|uniref:CmcJ/NvfI family oxidoreductase n=1 Tax=Caballeronia sp. SEWSISQ10-4 2 TaxID=2937438 RepID=UPI00264DBADD|nr:CmcJ/NvfI family oxidoreductase [Caballeronia sp. SEWSISQ10-4 2]MDN7184453.1 hypothetical protein [Caballeronia sp. SEWSISQ10-4 2]